MFKFRRQEAKSSSILWNITKTLSQSVVIWVVFFFSIPFALSYLEQQLGTGSFHSSSELKTVAIVLFILGGALDITSGFYMTIYGSGTPLPSDCPRKLIVIGPYRYIRNPMAIGCLTQAGAVGLFLGSIFTLFYTFGALLIWNFYLRKLEEIYLKKSFGSEYEKYCQNVKCWFPRFPGYQQ